MFIPRPFGLVIGDFGSSEVSMSVFCFAAVKACGPGWVTGLWKMKLIVSPIPQLTY